ncbi:cysteinyl leukotriene receptor 1 [Echeneis naucrates]|uniref:Cysteinyl leukotriene receptor 1-like n=1 Tax=Echeneis naucrates TaxID=173247 RepID=A0A665U2V0_ECHNA|nr:cysteinyl leukotriene receptor 1-like [Echeneis naucrates]
MNEHLITIPISNDTTKTVELLTCFHDDDAFKYQAYIYTFLLVFPVAFLCNIGALVIFYVHGSHRKTPSSVVMMNMAISDGSFALTLPLRLAYYFRGGIWDFSDWVCRLCVYGFYVNLYTSILFLTLLSVLRWIAVTMPHRHDSLATPKRVLFICLFIWLFVGVSSIPFLCDGIVNRQGFPRCFEPSSPSSWGRILILNYVGVALGFLLPFLTIIACYSRLVRELMAKPRVSNCNQSQNNVRDTRKRSVYLVAMVTATFLLCFLPYHIIRSLHLHAVCGGWDCDIVVALQRAVVVTLCLAASNCMINPLLYYYSTKTFRDKMRDVQSSIRSRSGSFRSGRGQKRSKKNSIT